MKTVAIIHLIFLFLTQSSFASGDHTRSYMGYAGVYPSETLVPQNGEACEVDLHYDNGVLQSVTYHGGYVKLSVSAFNTMLSGAAYAAGTVVGLFFAPTDEFKIKDSLKMGRYFSNMVRDYPEASQVSGTIHMNTEDMVVADSSYNSEDKYFHFTDGKIWDRAFAIRYTDETKSQILSVQFSGINQATCGVLR